MTKNMNYAAVPLRATGQPVASVHATAEERAGIRGLTMLQTLSAARTADLR
jgi:hypothetical protein